MTAASASDMGVERGSHVCWVVDDDTDYIGTARRILSDGEKAGEKAFAFGSDGGEVLDALRPFVAVAADPRTAFLGGGPLRPEVMFQMFREESAKARDEGSMGLRLVADMDWLLLAEPSTDDVVAFEVCLDRVVSELDATIVCAYRRRSFDTDRIVGVSCVHPVAIGHQRPPFRLVAGDDGAWRLSGEVDLAGASAFMAAITAVAGNDGGCILDATDLDFIDVRGLGAIAAASVGKRITIRGAPEFLERCWKLGGFDAVAPSLEIAN